MAVEDGESAMITRDGEPVARLVGVERDLDAVIEAIMGFGRAHPLEGITVKELIEEGRRF
ncbi:MAG: type II toxin-antitoxin system prevent-host-death family antitoxin [Dehalococcoidia bacterium]|nr:type II toxin-antitoxin system prevent-host-death family antitoxin [Dehalococcoidia bacterium]